MCGTEAGHLQVCTTLGTLARPLQHGHPAVILLQVCDVALIVLFWDSGVHPVSTTSDKHPACCVCLVQTAMDTQKGKNQQAVSLGPCCFLVPIWPSSLRPSQHTSTTWFPARNRVSLSANPKSIGHCFMWMASYSGLMRLVSASFSTVVPALTDDSVHSGGLGE